MRYYLVKETNPWPQQRPNKRRHPHAKEKNATNTARTSMVIATVMNRRRCVLPRGGWKFGALRSAAVKYLLSLKHGRI